MAAFNSVISRLFDLFLAPAAYSAWLGMVLISLLTALAALVIFRYTSPQRAIRAVKDRIISHLLEAWLYRDEPRVVLRAQMRLLRDNLRYLAYAFPPLACLLLPIAILLIQADLRFARRPLRVGEQAIVTVRLSALRRHSYGASAAGSAALDQVSISVPAGLALETPALRLPAVGEDAWRIRALSAGAHHLRITVGQKEFTKEVVIEKPGARLSTRRVAPGLWQQFLHPGEPPLPADRGLSWIEVSYPAFQLRLFRWRLHWVWPWLILSMAFGYVLKGPLRVHL